MTSPLRQRRQLETARDIQKATLELAARKRLEDVTTEEIAVAAGVSTRTFFNYYPNKEGAAVGRPPRFSEENRGLLRNGSGPLRGDIKVFLEKHIDALEKDAPIMRSLAGVLRSNEKARGILAGFLAAERESLEDVLFERIKNRQAAAALASHATDAIGRAIQQWQQNEDTSLAEALDIVWQGLIDASRLLSMAD